MEGNLLNDIRDRAKKLGKTIALPEGDEERTIQAADIILSEGIAKIILLGDPDKINELAKKYNLKHINQATIINPLTYEKRDDLADIMVELRKHKGMTKEKALDQLNSPYYMATLLIKAGLADGMVAGANAPTADTIRPALQYIKTQPGINIVSGAFIMVLPDKQFGDNGVMVFADCAVTPDPDAQQLAEIAVVTAQTAKAIAGIEPRIAMLSFSTKGSADHPMVDKVVKATQLAKEMKPDLMIDGELQADAAIIPKVGEKKAPGSPVAGKANVLVFPDLQSGNIAYKLVQRMAHAEAIGPILQGLAAPINDLSRGCSVEDIVNLVAITANQAAAQ